MNIFDQIDTRTSRRRFLAGAAGFSLVALPSIGRAAALDATEFGAVGGTGRDQTRALQSAIDSAAKKGRPLLVGAGTYPVATLNLPSGIQIAGVAGATKLVALTAKPVLTGENAEGIFLSGISVDGQGIGDNESHSGLVSLQTCANLAISACGFSNITGNGLFTYASSGRITDCRISGASLTGLFAVDSAGLSVSGNTVSDCGNGGIRVFRNQAGADGTIISQNRISNIRSGSGNGQNGNGINVFRANGVIVAGNVISDVDFSAVRLNSTEDSLVKGNSCTTCQEVAIFSEFAFSGSIIAENVIDGAAAGISITNFNKGGRLAVCMGNIVRNILVQSPTNPDVTPIGIFAEADVAITGNVVENVPGAGIGAGWGEYLRDVLIANNIVRETRFGIGVSVAPGAGRARISGNLIAKASEKAIAGFAWKDQKGDDLAVNPGQFANVTVEGNTVS